MKKGNTSSGTGAGRENRPVKQSCHAATTLLVLGLLVGSATAPRAARAEVVVPAERVDTATRAIPPVTHPAPFRLPDSARYAELRARKDLQYRPPNYRPAQGFWERFWRRFWRGIDWVFNRPGTGVTIEWLWYAFLIAAVAWVVLKVLKLEITSAFRRAPREVPPFEVEEAESPFTDDLADRLAEAETAGNYRLAVRLGYLSALRQLADRELVRWLPDKTNSQYLRELPPGALRDHFARLTRQFEVAWYGELHPTADDYAAVRTTRTALTQLLRSSAPVASAAEPPAAR